MKIAVIGAGASGLLASIIASDWGEVDVYEKNNTAGKKLLLTGSGKCNIGNIDNDIKHYHSSNMDFLKKMKLEEKIKDVKKLLEGFGIILKNKNGYLYPFSEKSSSVKSCLLANARVRGVNFYYDVFVDNIIKNKNKFIINGNTYDKVIITTGGKSYEKTGSDGNGYKLAECFNHNIIKTYPSLVGLKTNTGYEKDLFGVRTTVDLSLYVDGSLVKKESGELQFTKDGLSGICIFNLSRDVNKYLEEKKEQGFIIIDKGNNLVRKLLLPKMKKETYDNLSSEILEKDSNESLIIQLADTCAYTNNMKLTSDYKSKQGIKDKKKSASEKFSSITKENTILVNVVNNEKTNKSAS